MSPLLLLHRRFRLMNGLPGISRSIRLIPRTQRERMLLLLLLLLRKTRRNRTRTRTRRSSSTRHGRNATFPKTGITARTAKVTET